MEYKRCKECIVARIDRGEEILEAVKKLSLQEDIRLASVSGLGAVDSFTIGVFKPEVKVYDSNEFLGNFEIVSLTGTINTMEDEFYCHLHMSAGGEDGRVVGGHLNRAVVSGTCELVIRLIDGRVDRVFDEEVGLNLFDFS